MVAHDKMSQRWLARRRRKSVELGILGQGDRDSEDIPIRIPKVI